MFYIIISGGSRISHRGGHGPHTGGRGPPRRLRFKNFACQNERIWTRRGGHVPGMPPLDPPMIIIQYSSALPLALHCVCTVHLCPRHPDVTVATQTKHPSPWSLCSSGPANLTLKATELKPQSLFLQES